MISFSTLAAGSGGWFTSDDVTLRSIANARPQTLREGSDGALSDLAQSEGRACVRCCAARSDRGRGGVVYPHFGTQSLSLRVQSSPKKLRACNRERLGCVAGSLLLRYSTQGEFSAATRTPAGDMEGAS